MALTALASAWVVGLALGLHWRAPQASLILWSIALGSLALFSLSLRRRLTPGGLRLLLWGALSALALLGGLWWGSASLGDSHATGLERFTGAGAVALRGRVVSDPEQRGAAYRLRLAVETLTPLPAGAGGVPPGAWRQAQGTILVTLQPTEALARVRDAPHVRYGDRLELRGRLETPPTLADFDYRKYLERQGVAALMLSPRAVLLEEGGGSRLLVHVYALRHRLAEGLQRTLPEPQGSLAQALLLGLRAELPPEVNQEFIATGTSHLLAISGQNVAILLGVVLGASVFVLGGGRGSLLVPLATLWLYTLVSGMDPPVARAAIMGSLYLGSRLTGRQSAGFPALAAAAGVMAGLDPRLLWDVSFQLSFTAVASMILLAPPIQERLDSWAARFLDREGPAFAGARAFNLALAVGVAATVSTLPITAFTFHRVSLVGIPATMVVLPGMSLALVGSGATAALGLLWGPLGTAAGWITWAPLNYMLGMVHLVAALPGITFNVGPVAPMAVGAFYGLLLLFVVRRHTRRWISSFFSPDAWQRTLASAVQGWPAPRSRVLLRWGLLAMALAAALLWAAALAAPDGKLHVTFLDVGQGDAMLVVTPSGRQVLVDGGPDHRRALRALGARSPFWDRSLDVVVLTHPHQDHVGGLTEVARRYRTEMAIRPPVDPISPSYREWLDALEARGGRTRILEAVAGQGVRLGDGVVLRVLHPEARLLAGTRSDVDNNSIVMRLEYGAVSFLLAGDIYAEAERVLVSRRAALKATVLKVGHHGSREASSLEFLGSVAPALAVVSVGAENRFGHPHPQALERLHTLVPRDRVLLTSERGDIHLTTDGRRLWLETER